MDSRINIALNIRVPKVDGLEIKIRLYDPTGNNLISNFYQKKSDSLVPESWASSRMEENNKLEVKAKKDSFVLKGSIITSSLKAYTLDLSCKVYGQGLVDSFTLKAD